MVKKTFIIAEAGVNHNGSLKRALRLVESAARIGADAVKFQTFQAEKLASSKAAKAPYQKKTTSRTESQKGMISKLELSAADHVVLMRRCRQLGITFLSSPFDEDSAALLHRLRVPLFKIPSGEITNRGFLEYIAAFGRPMILSTGMSTLAEVRQAVSWIRRANPRTRLSLLHCVTEYPAPFDQVNLRAMGTLSQEFGLPVGYSDHTPNTDIPIAAVALGATIIEKHFTLDRTLPGPDHKASLEPEEFAKMVIGIRHTEQALGDGRKRPASCELPNKKVARKSLVAARDLKTGARLRKEDIVAKRPGTGIPPFLKSKLIGKTLKKPIKADDLFTWRHL